MAVSGLAFAGGVDDKSITAPELQPRDDCALPASSQALLAQGDQDSYFLAPGGSFEGDSALNWYLADGARVATVANSDGTTNNVLEIPSGGQAVSPVICVTVDCPHARIFARNVIGGDDVDFGVSYYRDGAWSKWKHTGNAKGKGKDWGLSGKLNIQPEKKDGYQQVRFAFYGGGKDSLFQVDDLWVDPRASR
jgi:hypothetical protein